MQDQDVSALFEKGTNTSTTSAVIQQTHVVSPGVAAPVPGVRKRTSAATRVVVKRRVIRGSSVLRHATEADIDAYLEADCHREMVRCDATSVNIVPSLPASTPEAGFLQHEQQQQQALQHQGALQCQTPPELCATCTPSYPAKRSMSGGCAAGVIGTRITWRVPQLLTTWGLVGSGGSCTGYGSNSSSSNNNNNSNKDLDSHMIDIAPYAAMDEAKAISMFLKQVRMYRRDVMTSMQRAVTDDIGAHTAAQRLGDHDDVGDDDEWRQQRPQRQHRKKYGALLSNDLFSCTGGGKYSSRGRPSPMSVRSFSADDQFAIQSQQQNRHISATNATATAHPTAGTDAASNTTKTGSLGAPVCDGDGMPTSTPAATADDDSRYKYCGTGLGFGGGGVRVVTKPGRPAQMRSVSDLHGGRVGMPLAAGAVSAEACSVAAAARAVRNQRSNADRPHTPPAACQPPPPPRRTTDVVAGKDNEENGGQTQSSSDRRHKRKSVEYDEEEEEDEEDEEECFAHQQVLTRQTRLEVDTGFGAGMGAFGHRRGYMAACKTAGATKQVVGRGLQQHVRAQHDGRQMDGGLLQRLRSFRKRCGEEW